MNTILNASRGERRDKSGFVPALVVCLMAGVSAGGVYAQAGPGEPRVVRPAQGQVVPPKVAGPAIVHPLAVVPIPKEDPLAATYKPWEGKKIIIRRMGTPARYADMKAQRAIEVTNYSIVSTVIMYDQGNLEVRTETGTAWFSPSQVILVEDALPFFNEQVEKNRWDDAAYALRAYVQLELGELESAKRDASRAVQIAKGKSSDLYRARLYTLAWVYRKAGELEQAAECYSEMIRKDSAVGAAWRERGVLRNQTGRHEEAVKDFTEAVTLNTQDLNAHIGLAVARSGIGDYDGAVRSANYAVKYAYWKGSFLAERAKIHARAGDFEMALSDANEAMKLEPQSADAVNTRGLVYLMMWELDKAEADFKATLALDPQAAYPLGNLGKVELARRKFDSAGEWFDKARKLEPGATWLVCGRGVAHLRAGEIDEAVRVFERAATLNAADHIPHANLALCWLKLGMTNKADDAIGKAVQVCLVPSDEGSVPATSGRKAVKAPPPAKPEVQAVVRSPFVQAVRARVHAARGEFEKASEAAAEAVRLDPRDEFAANTQAWLWATVPDEKLCNGKKAVATATKLVERSKGLDPEHLETLAAAYAEAGEFDKAVESQLKAIRGYGITPAQVEKCREQLVKQDGPLVETWELLLVARLSGYERKIPYRLPVPTIGGGLRGSLGRF